MARIRVFSRMRVLDAYGVLCMEVLRRFDVWVGKYWGLRNFVSALLLWAELWLWKSRRQGQPWIRRRRWKNKRRARETKHDRACMDFERNRRSNGVVGISYLPSELLGTSEMRVSEGAQSSSVNAAALRITQGTRIRMG